LVRPEGFELSLRAWSPAVFHQVPRKLNGLRYLL